MVHIRIPQPPSTNNLFANINGGRVKSQAYKSWITAAGWELKAQKPTPIDGPVSIALRVGACNRARDLDNFLKPVIDMLVAHKLIKTDNLTTVIGVTSEQAFEAVPVGMVDVIVSPMIGRGLEYDTRFDDLKK